VSWDLTGSGKQILRAGVGRFYDFPYSNATMLFPAMAVQSNYGVVYNVGDPHGIKNADGTYFQPGQTLPPNQLQGADVSPPNEIASPTMKPPSSDQATLGYSWQVNQWLGINAEAVSIAYRDIPFRFRANPTDPSTGQKRFPAFGNFRVWYGKGYADYQGFNIGAHMRSEKFELQGFYTYSKATGNIIGGADEFRITRVEYQPDLSSVRDQSVNPYDPSCTGQCKGYLDTDSRHRVTFAGTYHLPLGINVSGMFRYRSATPYTKWSGTDITGDGYAFDLTPDTKHVNSQRGHSFSQFDLRFSKDFKLSGDIGVEVLAEVFNVFNSKNPAGYVGNCGYNTTTHACDNPAYGQPSTYAGDPGMGEQRLAQFGLRFHF
jgi:hypothetical protein